MSSLVSALAATSPLFVSKWLVIGLCQPWSAWVPSEHKSMATVAWREVKTCALQQQTNNAIQRDFKASQPTTMCNVHKINGVYVDVLPRMMKENSPCTKKQNCSDMLTLDSNPIRMFQGVRCAHDKHHNGNRRRKAQSFQCVIIDRVQNYNMVELIPIYLTCVDKSPKHVALGQHITEKTRFLSRWSIMTHGRSPNPKSTWMTM